jgi:hypothetical protein
MGPSPARNSDLGLHRVGIMGDGRVQGFVQAAVRLGEGMWLLRIEIGASGTNEDLRLVKVSGTDSSSGGIRTTEWSRIDDDPDHPLPSPAS